MTEEIVDIFDENYTHLGTSTKTDARRNGHWVRAIHTWIVCEKGPGFVLFQKRGRNKKIYPDALDISAAGHYRAGESIESGVREISEELGVEVAFTDLVSLGIKFDVGKIGDNTIHEFCHTFLLKSDLEIHEYALDQQEVDGLVKISIPDGLALFKGDANKVWAEGVEWSSEHNDYISVRLQVDTGLFIPRIDFYYYKIFILADRLLKKEKHLAI